MRNLLLPLAAAVAATAMPTAAQAEGGEGYADFRTGIAGGSGYSTETIGIAVGYDFDIGSDAFLGAEFVADTDLSFDEPVYGLNARLGVRTGDNSKIFGTLGYARTNTTGVLLVRNFATGLPNVVPVTGSLDDYAVGVGYQQDIGASSFFSIQFQRYLDIGYNRGSIGFGIKF